ncbi:MAG: hypothetical protein RIS25_576 [Actinomycetota bacterium]|jgi:hypothetical protein
MLNGWGDEFGLDSALSDAAMWVRRSIEHGGWDGPSRDAFDQQCEMWAHELFELARAATVENSRVQALALGVGHISGGPA